MTWGILLSGQQDPRHGGAQVVCTLKNLGAVPQVMALEDAEDLGLTLGHEQRGQQKGGTLSWRGQEVQFTATHPPHLEIHVPLGDMLLSLTLLVLALLS